MKLEKVTVGTKKYLELTTTQEERNAIRDMVDGQDKIYLDNGVGLDVTRILSGDTVKVCPDAVYDVKRVVDAVKMLADMVEEFLTQPKVEVLFEKEIKA